jgi:hypothetical protein
MSKLMCVSFTCGDPSDKTTTSGNHEVGIKPPRLGTIWFSALKWNRGNIKDTAIETNRNTRAKEKLVSLLRNIKYTTRKRHSPRLASSR